MGVEAGQAADHVLTGEEVDGEGERMPQTRPQTHDELVLIFVLNLR